MNIFQIIQNPTSSVKWRQRTTLDEEMDEEEGGLTALVVESFFWITVLVEAILKLVGSMMLMLYFLI